MSRRARILAAGVAAIALYAATAWLTFERGSLPFRPLYDGTHGGQAAPYRWVDPPPALAATNLPPTPGSGVVPLDRRIGSKADVNVFTQDFQARAFFYKGAFPAARGARRVIVTITPVDADTAGAPPPQGMEFQGNAYRVDARYDPAGGRAELSVDACDQTAVVPRCATVFLQTPFGAIGLYRLDDGTWNEVAESTEAGGGIFADSPRLGTFVALAEQGRIAGGTATTTGAGGIGDMLAIALAALAVAGAGLSYRVRAGAKKRRAPKRGGAKRKGR